MPAVTSAGEEVIRPCLCELIHISPSPGYVLYEALIIAVLIARLVHLQNIVVPLVKVEYLKTKQCTLKVSNF